MKKKNFDTFDMHRDPKNTSNLELQVFFKLNG